MTWTIRQLQQVDEECAKLQDDILRLHKDGVFAVVAAVARAQLIEANAQALVAGAQAFLGQVRDVVQKLQAFTPPQPEAMAQLVNDQLHFATTTMGGMQERVTAVLHNVTTKAAGLRDALSQSALEECLDEASDAIDEAVEEVKSQAESALEDLLNEVDDLGGELLGGVDEAVERLEEISDRVDALLTTAAEVGDAINEGTAEASDSLQVAADIVNLTRDCISQL